MTDTPLVRAIRDAVTFAESGAEDGVMFTDAPDPADVMAEYIDATDLRERDDFPVGSVADHMAAAVTTLTAERDAATARVAVLEAALARIDERYAARSELYNNDADLAADIACIARAALTDGGPDAE